jgi:hypothetical protein
VVDVTDRADVDVRLFTLKYSLCHVEPPESICNSRFAICSFGCATNRKSKTANRKSPSCH